MFARLLLVLLLAAFSLPAAAASCHDAPVPAAHAMPMDALAIHAMPMDGADHRPQPGPERPVAAHACVGCVPPSDLLGARIATPAPAPEPTPPIRVATLDLGGTAPPDLPPPRRN